MKNVSREKLIIRTSLVGILGNILLVGAKATIGLLSNSIAIISDALNNLTDALSSTITIIGTKLAGKKPDKKHPYGHGRVEYITSVIIAIIIIFAGSSAIYESIRNLITPQPISYDTISIVIVSIAIGVKVALGLFFRFMAKKAKSDVLKASGTDALFDSLLSTSTLIAIIVAMNTNVNIEGYLGIGIGLFIIKGGIGILREGLSAIIGERTDKDLSDKIKALVCSFPGVNGAYDLILNNYGPSKSIGSVHIEVDDNMTAKEIHPLSREISAAAYIQFGVILTVGIYARNDNGLLNKEMKEEIVKTIKQYPLIRQLHGFYLDEARHTVSFDLIFDFKDEKREQEIEEIKSHLLEKWPDFEYFIVIDTDFTD